MRPGAVLLDSRRQSYQSRVSSLLQCLHSPYLKKVQQQAEDDKKAIAQFRASQKQ